MRWSESVFRLCSQTIGQLGVALGQNYSGDVVVSVNKTMYIFNYKCLIRAPEEKVEVNIEGLHCSVCYSVCLVDFKSESMSSSGYCVYLYLIITQMCHFKGILVSLKVKCGLSLNGMTPWSSPALPSLEMKQSLGSF